MLLPSSAASLAPACFGSCGRRRSAPRDGRATPLCRDLSWDSLSVINVGTTGSEAREAGDEQLLSGSVGGTTSADGSQDGNAVYTHIGLSIVQILLTQGRQTLGLEGS